MLKPWVVAASCPASVVLLVALIFSYHADADPNTPKSTSVLRGRGISWYPFVPRQPTPIGRFEDIPENIRAKLAAHLLERFGEQYMSQLQYLGGDKVDTEEVPLQYDDGRQGTFRVPKYSVFYGLPVPTNLGIEKYEADIGLSALGEVVREIELPPIRRFPNKQQLTSLRNAYSVAAANGFVPAETDAQISYDTKLESIVFELEQTLENHGHYTIGRKAVIDAHSGQLARIEKTAMNLGPCKLDEEPLCVRIDDKGNIGFGRAERPPGRRPN